MKDTRSGGTSLSTIDADLAADAYEELHQLTEAYHTAVVMPAPEVRYSELLGERDQYGEVEGAGW